MAGSDCIQPVPTGRACGDPDGGPGGCMKGDQSFVENLEAHARQHVDANNFRFNGTDPSDTWVVFTEISSRDQGASIKNQGPI